MTCRLYGDKIIVIPAYNPDENLMKTVQGILEESDAGVVIVDDGSGAHAQRHFPACGTERVTVLTHESNRGKGRALKTAFSHIMGSMPDVKAVVTMDGDGQHSVRDALGIAGQTADTGAVTLGARDFDEPKVPFKSRLGNTVSRGVFRQLLDIGISDTQTGLRGFPASLLPLLSEVPGERFEYETNVLLALHEKGFAMDEMRIETLYTGGNESSHYRPFFDSLRIFSAILRFFKFSMSSLAAALIDNVLFYLFLVAFSGLFGLFAVTMAFAAARLLSSVFNFTVNRRFVFRSERAAGASAARYYVLAAACFLAGALALNLVALPSGLQAGTTTLVKIAIDSALFLLSFRIQRKWVFGT